MSNALIRQKTDALAGALANIMPDWVAEGIAKATGELIDAHIGIETPVVVKINIVEPETGAVGSASGAIAPADEAVKPVQAAPFAELEAATAQLEKTMTKHLDKFDKLLVTARCLAAYALNVAYGGKLDSFELEHVTELAAGVGCKVTPRQLQHASIRAVLDALLAERLRQIGIGYDAAYDDANPLHGRMEAIQRLNDPNHTSRDIVEAAAILVADLERRNRLPDPQQPPADGQATGGPAGGTSRKLVNGHDLYQATDADAPELVRVGGLGICRVCGAGEIELDVACTGSPPVRA